MSRNCEAKIHYNHLPLSHHHTLVSSTSSSSVANQKSVDHPNNCSIVNSCAKPVHYWLNYQPNTGYTVIPAKKRPEQTPDIKG